jgi:hypothetical protein
MFGRLSRRELRSIDAIREELSAADIHARAVLTDAIAQVESRLDRDREDRERAQLVVEMAIEHSHSAVTTQAMDVARVLEQVSNTCAMVAQQVETDRSERRALTEAIALLARQLGAPSDAGVHALGGTVFGAPEIEEQRAPIELENDTGTSEPSDPHAGADKVSVVDEPRTESSPAEETIDLRERTDTQFVSRKFPRWSTKRL